jgi:hypothetical protein
MLMELGKKQSTKSLQFNWSLLLIAPFTYLLMNSCHQKITEIVAIGECQILCAPQSSHIIDNECYCRRDITTLKKFPSKSHK